MSFGVGEGERRGRQEDKRVEGGRYSEGIGERKEGTWELERGEKGEREERGRE